MPILLLIIMVIIFILVDIVVRYVAGKVKEKQVKKEREEILHESLNLTFDREAKTLKRVEVKEPKAKILCVDDEAVILDSFRKILVLDGYSVDTVETGQEALGLIQSHNYDFVFTDLKMPSMDGVDVAKSVKHLRPDIDVVIITGYATVETAVECMKHGAMDYVEKPFTEDELLDFVKKIIIKRTDRIRKQLLPKVHITHLEKAGLFNKSEFEIPGGVFISQGHCWATISPDGTANIGIDDFAKKIIGRCDKIEFPNQGRQIKKGEVLFYIKQDNKNIPFLSPLTGQVITNNQNLNKNLETIDNTPYYNNWICNLNAVQLDSEIQTLKIGKSAVDFFLEDIESFKNILAKERDNNKEDFTQEDKIYLGELEKLSEQTCNKVVKTFFERK